MMIKNLDTKTLNRRTVGRLLLAMEFAGDGIGAPGRIVLAHEEGANHPFRVHWQNRQDGGCGSGGYHRELSEALEDMAERVRREERYARARAESGMDGETRTYHGGDA